MFIVQYIYFISSSFLSTYSTFRRVSTQFTVKVYVEKEETLIHRKEQRRKKTTERTKHIKSRDETLGGDQHPLFSTFTLSWLF